MRSLRLWLIIAALATSGCAGYLRLFTLGQLDEIRIKVVLTDRMLQYIEEGMTAEILSDHGTSDVLRSKLSRISPFLNPVSHSTEAEIDLQNPDGALKPGMFVPVDIFYGESEQATLVPLSALFENPSSGATGVYVTNTEFSEVPVVRTPDGRSIGLSDPVDFTFVPVGVLAKGRMEAGIEGIDPGKWVITMGQNLMGADKSPARVRPVQWARVERLQTLQREDLMEDLVKNHEAELSDTLLTKGNKSQAD